MVIIKQLLNYILWQSIKKPNKRTIWLTIFCWLVVLFLLFLSTIILSFDNINYRFRIVLVIYIVLNILCFGASRDVYFKKERVFYLMPFSRIFTIIFALPYLLVYINQKNKTDTNEATEKELSKDSDKK
ncbi:hypothetical protein ACNNMU_09700 [Aerococcus viridans]